MTDTRAAMQQAPTEPLCANCRTPNSCGPDGNCLEAYINRRLADLKAENAALRAALEAPQQAEPILPPHPEHGWTWTSMEIGFLQRWAADYARRCVEQATREQAKHYATPQPRPGWVLVPARLLQKAADVLEEATTYTGSESWSPSMTDELLALRQEMLAARPKEPQA